uniref:RING-type domain-containing protein n=1 Tax=Strongyloides papillosus TaxID=174720 RepID=A0A0N5BCB9_STREA
MFFYCGICHEACSVNGTDHATHSKKGGHLFGKSCLENWVRKNGRRELFRCPKCYKESLYAYDCRQIFDLSKKSLNGTHKDYLSEDDLLRNYRSGKQEKGTTFFL